MCERVLVENGRAVGVRFRQGGVVREVRAAREVILCAGSHRLAADIAAVGNRAGSACCRTMASRSSAICRGIGANLQDHLQLRCSFRVHGTRTLNTLSASLWGKARIAAEYAWRRTGPMSMSPSQLGAFARSSPDVATADLEYHVQPLSLDAFGEDLHPFDAITASVCNLRPESRGHVRIASPDPVAHPVIQPNYLSTAGDRRVAADAIRLTRRIMAQPAMAQYRPEEFKPGTASTDDDALAEAAGDIGTTIFHPVGTVRMGPDAEAPLDPQLAPARASTGLRVVDASVMPTITSGNTNAPVIMIAEKAADMIRAHLNFDNSTG